MELKREIQIQILHEKQSKGEQITNTTSLRPKESLPNPHLQTIEEKTSKNEQAEKAVDEKVIENLKYPSVGKLQDMGIDYKPTTRYKI